MSKKDCMKFKGEVVKALQGSKFIVKVKEPAEFNVTCSLSGKMRQNNIRIIEGDAVEIETSVYDFNTGRINWRFK